MSLLHQHLQCKVSNSADMFLFIVPLSKPQLCYLLRLPLMACFSLAGLWWANQ